MSAANGNVTVAGWKYRDSNLKPSERRAWMREPDGSQAVGDDSIQFISSLHLKIHLEPGWEYVETEDWTPDYLGRWAPSGADGGVFFFTCFSIIRRPVSVSNTLRSWHLMDLRWMGVHQRCLARSACCPTGRVPETWDDKETEMDLEDLSHPRNITPAIISAHITPECRINTVAQVFFKKKHD